MNPIVNTFLFQMDISIVLDFLKELSANNQREWFHANKAGYETAKAAFERVALEQIMRVIRLDDTVGAVELKDCTYRIYRDTRFSADKTPYKTHMGVYVVRGGKKSPFAGYYLHLEPGNCFVWGGSHMPQPRVLNALREEIYHRTGDFKAIIQQPQFMRLFGQLDGEKLKTSPKGFDKNFADIDLLRYKSYGAMHTFTDMEVTASDFSEKLDVVMAPMVPLVRFFNNVIEDLE